MNTPKIHGLTGLLLLHPLKKRTENGARGCDRVEIYREIVPGLELVARYQRAIERADASTNSKHQSIVSGCSLFR